MTGRRLYLACAALSVLASMTPLGSTNAAPAPGETVLISARLSDQLPGNGASQGASISADGRYVAYISTATDLVAGDTNSRLDVFVRDLQTGTTELISVDSAEQVANADSIAAAISGNGRYVAFSSAASNLATGDTNNRVDIFVRDRLDGTTERVSDGSGAVQATLDSVDPVIDNDGRFVGFVSSSANLVAGDSNGSDDIFIKDRSTGSLERVSLGPAGVQANGYAHAPALSADGRFVAFVSEANNLVASDTNATADVFVRDRLNAITELISVDSNEVQTPAGSFDAPSISADGRYVVFTSDGSGLAAGDTNSVRDVFVRDRNSGTTTRVSVDSNELEGNAFSNDAVVSRNGRYAAFHSQSSNLVPGGAAPAGGIFIRDLLEGTTIAASVASNSEQANAESNLPALSADGSLIAFESLASNLVTNDTNGAVDVFLRNVSVAAADVTPPVITPSVVGTAGLNGWYVGNVTVSWTVTDAQSSFTASGCSPTTISIDTAGTTVTCQATSAGGANSQSVTIKRDATAPAAAALITPAANAAGWHKTNVSIAFSGTDAVSGGVTCTGSTTLTAETSTGSASGTCKDAAGNSSLPLTLSGIKIDKTLPTATASIPTPAPNAAGWNNSAVTVSYTGSDTLSGIASCVAPTVLTSDGAALSASGSCTDVAGNVSTPVVRSGIKLDVTPPAISLLTPGDSSQYPRDSAVVADYACTDATSGVLTCTAPVADGGAIATSTAGPFTFAVSATDVAGNTSTLSHAYSVTDSSPPVVTPTVTGTLGQNGWYTSNVSITWSVTDPETGVSSSTGCGPRTISADTDGETITCTATSTGGTTTEFVTIKRDATRPTASATASPTANGAGWRNSNVTVSFSGADALSAVSCDTAVIVSTEGSSGSASGVCRDAAGNVSLAASITGIKIDKTAPVASASAPSPAPNANGWNRVPVSVSFTGTDALSQVASCTSTVTFSSESVNHIATGTCTDAAGNTSVAVQRAGIKIDLTPPAVSIVTPGNGSTYPLNSQVFADYQCVDTLSGTASCSGPVAIGAQVTTNTLGAKSFAVVATDLAGNAAGATNNYAIADTSAPLVVPDVLGTLGNNGWYTSNVTVSWSVSDPESGGVTTTGCGTVVLSTNTSGQTYTCSATSSGGTTNASVTIKRDATVPVVQISSPADGAAYTSGTTVLANYTCTDATAGMASCSGPVASGAAFDTSGTGSRVFTVTARDLAGNQSQLTQVFELRPAPDVMPPTAPTALGAIATSASRIELSWTASTDNSSGVAGYRIYRNGVATPIATPTTTTYADTGLGAATQYNYTVTAVDVAGNESAASNTASATTNSSGSNPGATFQEEIVWSGFTLPVSVRFAPNGKVFVAEKSGIIKVFDSLADPTAAVFADLRTEVNEYWDRGLLGLAVDPGYPTRPYLYALYTVDAPPGGTPPFYFDECPNGQCPITSRLARLTGSGNTMTAKATILDGWCHDDISHSVGDLKFDDTGALFVSHGDGASFNYVDYNPVPNNCGDPLNEGGALRAQDLRTSGDPLAFNGSLIRIDPDTGLAAAGNPLIGGSLVGDDPMIAHGFRNPFRYARDSLTGRIWIADVGWNTYEEIDTIADPLAAPVKNFGWPCYEGAFVQSGYDAANIPLCENLYAANQVQTPYYAYAHAGNGGSIGGIALYRGANFPQTYQGALFFSDYVRGWINVMLPGTNGLPDPSKIQAFVGSGTSAVDLEVGPEGYLYWVDINSGTVRRVKYVSQNTAPTARIAANRTFGALPLSVTFSASASTDPDAGDTLAYAWDLDGDGAFDDSTAIAPTFTYTTAAVVSARVRVTDPDGGSSIAALVIDAGNTPAVANILTPSPSLSYKVGDVISFSGSATDAESGNLPASALNWRVVLHHCAALNPTNCHEHYVQEFDGVGSGSFVAPDHEFPMYMELRLTTRSGTLTTVKSVDLQPRTVTWTFNTVPAGLGIGIYGQERITPYSREVIVGAQTTLATSSPQALNGSQYQFANWSDGGSVAHLVTATESPQTFTATFAVQPPTCSLTATPASIVTGSSASLAWTTASATSLTIDQGFGAATPVAAGARSVSPTATTTYTGTVTSPAGTSTCSATLTVTAAPIETIWRSYEIVTQAGTPQGTLTSVTGNKVAQFEFYESTNDDGIAKGALFTGFVAGAHGEGFNNLERFWSSGGAAGYPYAGKSLVNRGSGAGEGNAPAPAGVRDLQLHPPGNAHLVVAAFRVPENGNYFVSDLAARRVDGNQGYSSTLRLFNSQGVDLVHVTATSTVWTTLTATFNMGALTAGQYIYFAVDSDENFFYDATEIAFQIRATGTTPPPAPTCSLSVTPGSIVQGTSATLSWLTTDAASLSIDQGIGAVSPVAGGSRSITPTANATYNGTVTGPSGTATCSATVIVTPPPPPTCSLSGTPASISQGTSSLLAWTTTNATALSINQGVGATPVASGSASVSPTTTTTYTGSVTGPGGTATCSTTITVTPPVAPTCALTLTPNSIVAGGSATLSWTTTSANSLSINQGVGAVTPVVSGSRVVAPAASLTYTGSVSGPGGTAGCAASLTVTAAPAETVWRSHDTVMLSTSPQGTVTSVAGSKVAQLEFYESTNNGGVAKGALFGSFSTAAHGNSFNKVDRLWSAGGSAPYPYAGKSTVNRGSDTAETNTPAPTGVSDLQLHPPANQHFTVAAFKVPENGAYAVTDLALRRVDGNPGNVRLRLFNAQGTLLANLLATSQAWVRSVATYSLGTLTAGQYIYFAVDGDTDSFYFDATEIAWNVRATGTSPPPPATCSLSGAPASFSLGNSAALSWITSNATSLSIDQGIGAATPVANGSTTVSPMTTTTYTGSVTGPGGSSTCSTTIVVTPAVAPTCALTVTPASIVAGASSTLSWTTTSATALSINQGVGAVTPVASGTRSVTPAATSTYTGSVTGPGGTANCTATLTVTAVPPETVWRSYETVVQGTAPQATVTSVAGSSIAQLEFYESTNNGGIAKGLLFGSFTTGAHANAFNRVERFWSPGGAGSYPYAGKSLVDRGSDVSEANTPAPTGVRDLQLHPPDNQHYTVAAFKVPVSGTYSVTDLALRRVDGNAGNVRLRLFGAQGTLLANLQATSRSWVRSTATFSLGTLTAGQYIYFAVDGDSDGFYFDATEIAWQVTKVP